MNAIKVRLFQNEHCNKCRHLQYFYISTTRCYGFCGRLHTFFEYAIPQCKGRLYERCKETTTN